MQFYDSNGQGICAEIDRLCDTTDTTYSRLAKTSRVNNALEQVISWIITADGTWQFDDKNFTTLPRGTATLTEGTNQYSFAADYLDIIRVEVLDLNGRYREIQPLDPEELGGMSWDEYFANTTSANSKGFPMWYDKNADGIVLAPAPTSTAVTLTNGLRVTFQRTGSLFTATSATTDDSTQPGFSSPFHVILAYMASIPYCVLYHPERVSAYMAKVGDTTPPTGMKRDLLQFYARRERDKRKTMTTKPPRQFK